MTSIYIQIVLVIISVSSAIWAIWANIAINEERKYWRGDEEMLMGCVSNRDEKLRKAHDMLLSSIEAHNKWLEAAKGNATRYKKQISSLKGQVTKLKKKVDATPMIEQIYKKHGVEIGTPQFDDGSFAGAHKKGGIPCLK